MSLVLTKAALALKNAENNFKFVKFESYKPKKKLTAGNVEKSETITQRHSNVAKDLELKKIRHEIVKFGMSGFDATKKEEAKIALAVSLGAKPPKREYVNYKELMQKRKQEKQKERDDKQLMHSKSILQTGGKKKKKTNNDVGHFLSGYGKVYLSGHVCTDIFEHAYGRPVQIYEPAQVQKKDLKKDDNGSKKKKTKKLSINKIK